ncbi:MAG: hypothetical protein KKI09_01290 [Spirochaetes bacterium]|nr:hypothetical protein [Spirochaetota bacterium]MBU0954036.1 hypothetical protein [Spirochaetota bacterium]
MKNHLLFLSLILLAPVLLEAQQLPAGWDSWKSQALQSAGSLELDSLVVRDLDASQKELRRRTIPRLLATRSLNEPHEALPDNMAASSLPGLFFTIPWDASSTAYTEPAGEPGRTLISLRVEMDQIANGELLYVSSSGQLVETRIRFNNQPLPSIVVMYSGGRIVSMIIVSIPKDPPAGGVYRQAQFSYK